ncbi:ninjurin-1 [Astyanax mexicanus]|uniref:Ninjurin-1-like n=1 Tax=Astyanax mexicanus TaxID=7994 RepID=A0A8B9JVS8_ASTMX|nr:ninjurin-1 [Astyanax mexicanus]KAG9269596.1 ninjurin-2-like isoform X1 [Astyanax mexicanus]
MEGEKQKSKEEDFPFNKPGDKESQGQTGKAHWHMDMNHYATKKSAVQSMLDVALLMANSSQLKTVLYEGPEYRFYIPLITLITLSITLQVIVGLLLIFIVKYNLNDMRKQPKLNMMNNVTTVLVFFIVLINVFITALGFDSARTNVTVPAVLSQTDFTGDD